MNKKILLLFLFFSYLNITAQAPTVQWQDTFGGSNYESYNSVVGTNDGGYIVTGWTTSTNGDIVSNHGDYDMLVVKYNATGAITWKKTFGGTGYEVGNAVRKTNDNGYIICGYTSSTDGDASVTHTGEGDYWIVKTDGFGNIQWQKSYGGSGYDVANDIRQTSDGGYIVIGAENSHNGDVIAGGYTGENIWVLKLNASGNIQWKKVYGGMAADTGDGIRETPDGDFVFSSTTNSCGQDVVGLHDQYNCQGSYTNQDFWIVKINQTGTILWKSCLGTVGHERFDRGDSFALTNDGGVIVCGGESPDGFQYTNFDYVIYKLSSLGVVEWKKKFGGAHEDVANGVIQTVDGGYIVVGTTTSNDYQSGHHLGDYGSLGYLPDIWLIKTNSLGIVEWKKCYGGTGSDYGYSFQQTADNGFIVAGATWSNNGDITANNGYGDAWILKLSAATLGTETFEKTALNIYPNPAQSEFFINTEDTDFVYRIYDSLGRIVKTGNGELRVNISDLQSGMYIYEYISSNQVNTTRKFLKI